ncbi:MAG: sensor histidine kinase N-terminal domain-containing protein [Ottowia sp.]|uniref:sensor histidine kinase n=1 Tax=Ottowia sp. TaxID=1898956 RepID=UPI0039E2DC8F
MGARSTAPDSLRVRLTRAVLLPLLAILPLAAYLQFSFVVKPAIDAFDHELGDTALALGNLLRVDAAGQPGLDINPQTEHALRTDRSDRLYFAVLTPEHGLLAGDPQLLQPALAPPAGGAPVFSQLRLGPTDVRLVQLAAPCGAAACEVRVAETLNKRVAARRAALLAVLAPMSLLAAALALVALGGIRRGLQPLHALGTELAERSLDRLDPVDSASAVAEIRPLIESINRLFERLRRASAVQQNFIAAAAHQLRTPLTSLRTEAELALLETHPPALTPTLARLSSASERAARVASQLLVLARTESPGTEQMLDTDLKAIAADAAEDWVRQASHRAVDLGFELANAPVRGRPMLLAELAGNLVHNAFEYAGAEARITVRTRQAADGRGVLEVEDDGPGIAPEHRARVLRRFQRGPGAPGRGSGLGLSIVHDIAIGHGAELMLLDARPPGRQARAGLLVRVVFPAVAPESRR